ncbi:hypothetical protein D3C72_2354150 [compost metagenome]
MKKGADLDQVMGSRRRLPPFPIPHIACADIQLLTEGLLRKSLLLDQEFYPLVYRQHGQPPSTTLNFT